jgi:predicted XRE-type DNA-binding protein
MNDELRPYMEALVTLCIIKLRNVLIPKLYLAFKDKPLTQEGLAEFFGVKQGYVSNLVARHTKGKENDANTD